MGGGHCFFLERRGEEGGELENKLNKYRYYVCVCVLERNLGNPNRCFIKGDVITGVII